MQSLKVLNDMSEQVEYGCADLPLRSSETDLAYFYRQTTDCHWHDDLEFLIVLHGSMIYYVEGRPYFLTAGMGIFVNSGRLHYGVAEGTEGCLHQFLLTGLSLFRKHEFLEKKYIFPLIGEQSADAVLLSPQISWQAEALAQISRCCRLFQERPQGYELMMTSQLDLLLLSLCRNALLESEKKSAVLTQESAMKRMIGYIRKNYAEKILLEDIAAAGAVCRSRCCQQFKAVMHMSPMEYLAFYRLERSRKLLQDPSASITEIAQSCGWGSSSYFGSQFKKQYGVTPREYQKQQQKTPQS